MPNYLSESTRLKRYLRTQGRDSRLVHIATHGYFRQDNPMFSSIRLGDTHLSLCDLAHFRIPAELVVLSGCATGLNVVTPGDELMGLVRGLLQAGAQSLILSLWDVHDESTKDFMIGFYRNGSRGAPRPRRCSRPCWNCASATPIPTIGRLSH